MKFFLNLFTLSFFIIVAVSWKNSEPKIELRGITSQLSINGQIHNEGLASILNAFQNKSDWKRDQIFKDLKVFTKNLLPMINKKGNYSLTLKEMEETISLMDEILPQIVNNNTEELSIFFLRKGIPSTKIDALKSVSSMLKKDYDSKEDIFEAILIQENSLRKKGLLDSALKESLNVLRASIIYWSTNVEAWEEIDYEGLTRKGFWDTINGMAESDFWSFATVTMMAGPQAGVAAGCYGSAAKGIKDLVTGDCC